MAKTVVGLMESTHEAEAVARNLVESCGCERADISLLAQDAQGATVQRNEDVQAGAVEGASGGAVVGGALGLLAGAAALAIPGFGPIIAAGPIASALAGAGIGAAAGGIMGALANIGVPDEDADYYAEGIRRGGTLVSVRVRSDEMADCAANVMRGGAAQDLQHGQADADERKVLPVAKEELVVGKREVSRGGVRVYSTLRETPAEERVQLREERAKVERRPVDRPAGTDAFKEKSIEIRETAEEAVVTKRARVVEEVVVSKETSEREETIRDTVRSTDVHVEQAGNESGELRRYRGPERRTNKAPYEGRDRRLVVP